MNKNKVAIEPHKASLIKQKTTDDKPKTKSNLPEAISKYTNYYYQREINL